MQQNDVYYRKSMLNISVSDAYRVTDTGIEDEIFNGVPDWVFEGRCLSSVNFKGMLPYTCLICSMYRTGKMQKKNAVSKIIIYDK